MSSSRFEAILRAAVPELEGLPLYIALSSEGLGVEFTKDGTGGYAGPVTDLALREWLGDRWRGRGPAFVIDDIMATRSAPADLPSAGSRMVLANVIHEMAHQLDAGLKYPEINDPDRIRQESDHLRAWAAVPMERPQIPFEAHSATWVRHALHLIHRVRQQGYAVDDEEVLLTGYYSLSRAADYRDALDSELFLCSSNRLAPFEDIARCPPPEEFASLWKGDVLRWLSSLGEDPSEEAIQAAHSYIAIYPRAVASPVAEEAPVTRLMPYSDCRVRVPM